MVLIFSYSKTKLINWKLVLFFGQNLDLEYFKTATFHLSEDNHIWVNPCNIGILRHAQYTTKKVLINLLGLCREFSIILFLCFIHSVQYDQLNWWGILESVHPDRKVKNHIPACIWLCPLSSMFPYIGRFHVDFPQILIITGGKQSAGTTGIQSVGVPKIPIDR